MNREQKAAAIEEVAGQIQESEAVFAVDYRGISVPQAAELRTRLTEAGARFRVVKNTLTERAVDQAGAESLKEVLEGPTAFTFVLAEAATWPWPRRRWRPSAASTTARVQGRRDERRPADGRPARGALEAPARDVLHRQLVGMIASPITGLVRGLNALISGLAIQLGQIPTRAWWAATRPRSRRPRRLRPRRPRPRRSRGGRGSGCGGGSRGGSAAEDEAPAEEAPAEEASAEEAAGDEAASDPRLVPRVTGLRLMKLMRPPRATRRNKEGPWPLLQN